MDKMKSAREITELDIHMEGRVPTDKVSPKICLDTIPSPANLIRKRLAEDPRCRLCGELGNMAHICTLMVQSTLQHVNTGGDMIRSWPLWHIFWTWSRGNQGCREGKYHQHIAFILPKPRYPPRHVF